MRIGFHLFSHYAEFIMQPYFDIIKNSPNEKYYHTWIAACTIHHGHMIFICDQYFQGLELILRD